ncbi:MAG: hypothetical protein JSU72_15260 [Deltaproteobacteria bacterium]|nr:MAG: hypothetical protein JSU72_15260 [Deltaproteobacteria bacterium]
MNPQDRAKHHNTYPDFGCWDTICRLKPLEAARRVGVLHLVTRADKENAKKGQMYVLHNKGYVALGPKDSGIVDPEEIGATYDSFTGWDFPVGTRALYCADGRHYIIEKKRRK